MWIEVTKADDLFAILDIVHDHFFALSPVLAQEGAIRTLELRGQHGFWRPRFSQRYEILTIQNVISVEVHDTARVEFYDINVIEFDGEKIKIRTGITLELSFEVSDLHLTLETHW